MACINTIILSIQYNFILIYLGRELTPTTSTSPSWTKRSWSSSSRRRSPSSRTRSPSWSRTSITTSLFMTKRPASSMTMSTYSHIPRLYYSFQTIWRISKNNLQYSHSFLLIAGSSLAEAQCISFIPSLITLLWWIFVFANMHVIVDDVFVIIMYEI